MNIDYLIVGQGLAGSLLAWELIQRGAQVLVVDNGHTNASMVAAGLLNPVSGMRFVKAKNIENKLRIATELYRQLEVLFGQKFYLEKQMLRIIRNEKELEYCNKRIQDPQYHAYLRHYLPPEQFDTVINAPLGMVVQQRTGHLLAKPLLQQLKNYFIAKNSYLKLRFSYRDIQQHSDSISWKNIQTRKIIFCEGYQSKNNPYFSWLPLQPVKGEILTLSTKNRLPDKILNYGRWLIPINNNTFRTGATFDRDNLNSIPTKSARLSLLASLTAVCADLKIHETVAHQANIRACTLDKNPFIGSHPQNRRILIFNGFGSKGSVLIPYYVKSLTDHLSKKIPLPESVDIKRYAATYFTD